MVRQRTTFVSGMILLLLAAVYGFGQSKETGGGFPLREHPDDSGGTTATKGVQHNSGLLPGFPGSGGGVSVHNPGRKGVKDIIAGPDPVSSRARIILSRENIAAGSGFSAWAKHQSPLKDDHVAYYTWTIDGKHHQRVNRWKDPETEIEGILGGTHALSLKATLRSGKVLDLDSKSFSVSPAPVFDIRYNAAHQTVQCDGSQSMGDFEGMRPVDVFFWSCVPKKGGALVSDKGKKVLLRQYGKGPWIVTLKLTDRHGRTATASKEIAAAPADVHLWINKKNLTYSRKKQNLEIKVVVRKVKDEKYVPCKGAQVELKYKIRPEIYETYLDTSIMNHLVRLENGQATETANLEFTDRHGVVHYQAWADDLLGNLTTFHLEKYFSFRRKCIDLTVTVDNPIGDEKWQIVRTATITVEGTPELDVTAYRSGGTAGEKIGVGLRYSGEARTSDYLSYKVNMVGAVTNGYVPISMMLSIYSRGQYLPLDKDHNKSVTLGQTPGLQSYTKHVHLWPEVELGGQESIIVILEKDWATECALQVLRTGFKTAGGLSKAAGEVLGAVDIGYEMVTKIRNHLVQKAGTDGSVAGGVDAPADMASLAVAYVSSHADEIVEYYAKKGITVVRAKYALLSAAFDTGMWSVNVLRTPSVAKETWNIGVAEVEQP